MLKKLKTNFINNFVCLGTGKCALRASRIPSVQMCVWQGYEDGTSPKGLDSVFLGMGVGTDCNLSRWNNGNSQSANREVFWLERVIDLDDRAGRAGLHGIVLRCVLKSHFQRL